MKMVGSRDVEKELFNSALLGFYYIISSIFHPRYCCDQFCETVATDRTRAGKCQEIWPQHVIDLDGNSFGRKWRFEALLRQLKGIKSCRIVVILLPETRFHPKHCLTAGIRCQESPSP